MKLRETEMHYNCQNGSYEYKKKNEKATNLQYSRSHSGRYFSCAACRSNYFGENSSCITLLSNLWQRATFLVIKKPQERGTMLKIYGANPHFPKIPLG